MPQFQWIEQNGPADHLSSAAKRRIRSHAAKEKNLGRKLARPPRNKQALATLVPQRRTVVMTTAAVSARIKLDDRASTETTSSSSSSDEATLERRRDECEIPRVERQVGNGLSVLFLPPELWKESLGLVRRAITRFAYVHYIPELYPAFQGYTGQVSMWFQLAFEDRAYFHIFVALAIVSLNSCPAGDDDPEPAARHLAQTFQLANRRLSQADAISDASLAVVVMMAHYERLRGRYAKGLAHVDGLQRMVEMRGGIVQIAREKPSLCQKITRLDLDFALCLGTSTRLTTSDVTDASSDWIWADNVLKAPHQKKSAAFSRSRLVPAELQHVALDVTYFAWLLNDANAGRRSPLNMLSLHGTVMLLGYRLINISPLAGGRPSDQLTNVVHLGLVAFILPFMYRLDGNMPSNPHLPVLIQQAAARGGLKADRTSRETLLWMLLIATTSASMPSLDDGITSLVVQLTHELGLRDFAQISRAMAKYPWIDAFHGESAQKIFRWHIPREDKHSETIESDGTVCPALTTRASEADSRNTEG